MSENTVSTKFVAIRQTSTDTTTSSGEEKRTADKAPASGRLAQARQVVTDKENTTVADAASVNKIEVENPLLKLKPQCIWKHFNEITKIYRPSRKEENGKVVASEAKMGDYIVKIAQENGLKFKRDAMGSIVVSVPASAGMENAPRTVIQGHQDMVCVDENGKHDFEKDPMKVKVEGNIVKAEGTSLGADNGIGIAAMLAIMENKTLVHGPLELLFTVDEENAWLGVLNLSGDFLPPDCEYMINVDNYRDNMGCIGAAGVRETNATKELDLTDTKIEDPVAVEICINGLTGGHSGVDIEKGRANAIELIAKVLLKVNGSMPMDIVSINGGITRYAITSKSSAVVVISRKNIRAFEEMMLEKDGIKEEFEFKYKNTDPKLAVSVKNLDEKPSKVIAGEQKNKIIDALNRLPHGVISKNKDIPELVETSTNLAIVETKDGILTIGTSQRSFVESEEQKVSNDVKSILINFGGFEPGKVLVENIGAGWTPDVNSKIIAIYKKAGSEVLGNPPEIKAIHGALECAELIKKYPQLKMISIGPYYEGEHTPNEYVKIDSVERFWNILNSMLEEIGKQK